MDNFFRPSVRVSTVSNLIKCLTCTNALQAKYLGLIEPSKDKSWPKVHLSKQSWSDDEINGDPIPNMCAGMKIPKNVHGCGLKLSYR